jgi:hypothetical protein
MAARRNPFDVSHKAVKGNPVPSIYDSLRVAAPRARNRRWERAHQDRKVVYRGVAPKLALQVKATAEKLRVPVGEVARAVLEYALQAYAEGDLNLQPRPDPDRLRMTLFPSSHKSHRNQTLDLSIDGKTTEPTWRVITTWRGLPPELKAEIAALASRDGLDVPIGELVSALLRYGLKAYEGGVLMLKPTPAARVRALQDEGDR